MADTPNIFQGASFAEHGDREKLRGMASAAEIPQSVGNGPPVPATAPPVMGANSTGLTPPMQRVMASPVDDLPITDGLSLGPGASPPVPGTEPSMVLSKMEKLAAIALYAKSPSLRAQAAHALKVYATRRRVENG